MKLEALDSEVADQPPRFLCARRSLGRIDRAESHHDVVVLGGCLGDFLIGKTSEPALAFGIHRKNHAADLALAVVVRDLLHRQFFALLAEVFAHRFALLEFFRVGKLLRRMRMRMNVNRNKPIDVPHPGLPQQTL